MQTGIQLGGIDYVILVVYFLFVLGIGWALKRYTKTSEDFFLSGRSIPAWIAGLAFLSANLGAQEMIGMAASGAKYGIMTSHFYWVGAIPAMVFVGIFMMPFYYGSRARSVPEYLKLRFDEKTRAFNAISFAVMTVFSSGISMYALAKLLNLLLGWDFNFSLWVSAIIVLAYIYLGGLTSAIYNEVLQFFLIVLGFAPLVYLGLKNVGGWTGLKAKLETVATANDFAAQRLEQLLVEHDEPAGEPDGRRVVRDGDGPRLRALLRLLVHGLPGRAARHGRELDGRRAAHAADRRGAEDALPVPGHLPGHDRDRAHLLDRQQLHAAQDGRRDLGLHDGDPEHAGALLPAGRARASGSPR